MKLKSLLNEKYLGFGNQGKKPIVQEDQQITDAAKQIVEKLISIGIITSWNRKRAEQALDIELSGIRFGGGLEDTDFDSTGIKDTELMPGEPDQYKDLTKGYGQF